MVYQLSKRSIKSFRCQQVILWLQYGVKKYNDECRGIVDRYVNEWEKTIGRLGRWVDFKNDYKTMDLTFMESTWWVFKSIWDKGLIYQGNKIVPYSPAFKLLFPTLKLVKIIKTSKTQRSQFYLEQKKTLTLTWRMDNNTLDSSIEPLSLCASRN